MQKSFKFISLNIFVGMSLYSFAMPTQYLPPGREPTNIRNTTNSIILHDSHSSNEFYVMPPKSGHPKAIKFSGQSALLPLCDSISTEIKIFNMKMEKQKVREETLVEYKLKLKSTLLDVIKAEELYVKAKLNKINREKHEENKLLIDFLETQLKELKLEIENIQDKNSDLYNEKTLLKNELIKEISSQKLLGIKLEINARREQHEEDFAKEFLELCKEDAIRYRSLIEAEESDAIEELSIQKAFGQYADIYGAMLELVYTSNWDENIIKLRADNPGKNFSAILTKNAIYNVDFVQKRNSEDIINSFPIYNSYALNGHMFDSQSVAARKANSLSITPTAAVNVNLNLLGACPYYKPDAFGIQKDERTLPILNFSSDYIYFAAYNMSVTAKYNFYQVYQTIVKTKTKNGLFTTRATKEEIKDALTFDDIDVTLEDESGHLSEEQKDRIKTDIKIRVVGRLMQIIGTPVGGANPNVPDIQVPERGAVIASDTLSSKKICLYQNWLCRAADWWLITLSNSIGGKTNESIFGDTYNVVVTEKLSEKIISEFPGSTTYARGDE